MNLFVFGYLIQSLESESLSGPKVHSLIPAHFDSDSDYYGKAALHSARLSPYQPEVLKRTLSGVC
jgi:hypothetical protein